MTTHALDFALLMPAIAPNVGDGIQVVSIAPTVTGWAPAAAGGGIADAPSDGNAYGRMNAAWQVVLNANSILDAGTY